MSPAPSPAPSRKHTAVVGDLRTESGELINDVRMSYQTWGRLNEKGDNAVLVLHALTGDSHVVGEVGPGQPTSGWWPDLIGPGCPIDTDKWFVLAPNVLGGCRGSTGPASAADDGKPYGSSFPHLSIRDQVNAEAMLADALQVSSFAAVFGGSMGGMRSIEWAVSYPGRVKNAAVIAASAIATADQIAWATPQIHAIRGDAGFCGGDYYPGPGPRNGLEVARQIAHTTYRAAQDLDTRFGPAPQLGEEPLAGGRYAVQSYLQHHGRKLVRRFDANAYLILTEAMNSHDIGRGRGGVEMALRRITGRLRVLSITSDRLFTVADGAVLATSPSCVEFTTIDSPYGHDAFLIETKAVFALVSRTLYPTRVDLQTPTQQVMAQGIP